MNTNEFADLGLLAEVAYVNFYDKNGGVLNNDDIINNLQVAGLSESQITQFFNDWTVESQQLNTDSGFSAVVFQSQSDPSRKVIAMRGTEGNKFFSPDDLDEFFEGGADLKADIADIVADGLAMHQIVDLHNYWSQLNAAEGESYQVKVLETDVGRSFGLGMTMYSLAGVSTVAASAM